MSDPETTPAKVCWRDLFGNKFSEREYLVRLPDGFLLSCGIDGYSERRAQVIAKRLNEEARDAES